MRLIFLVILIWSIPSPAEKVDPDWPECIDVRDTAYEIVQKLDDHLYEIQGGMINSTYKAVMKTKKAVYTNVGKPMGISIKRVGSKEMELKNGFTETYNIWVECAYDPEAETAIVSPGLALPKAPKGTKPPTTFIETMELREKKQAKLRSRLPHEDEEGVNSKYNKCTEACFKKHETDKAAMDACYAKCE